MYVTIRLAMSVVFLGCAQLASGTNISSASHAGMIESEPGGATRVWSDLQGRYSSDYQLVANQDGDLVTLANLEWDIGPVTTQELGVFLSGMSIPSGIIGHPGDLSFINRVQFVVEDRTRFVFLGEVEALSSGSARLALSGAGLEIDGNEDQTEIIASSSVAGQDLINYSGYMNPGIYRFDVSGVSVPLGGSFEIDALLRIPTPASGAALVIGLVLPSLARRKRTKA